MEKKTFFYEVEPKYFMDGTGNGCGDLKGLSKKLDYFKYLGIDAIVLPNLLSAYSDDEEQGFKSVARTYGSITDFKKVLSNSKKLGINILVEINIGSIKETHKWFKNALKNEETFAKIVDFQKQSNESMEGKTYKFNEKTKSYYLINEHTREVVLNWTSQETLDKFIEVAKFWIDLGVKGFTFTNFEQIDNNKNSGEILTKETLNQLRKFYISIKEIDKNILVVGKSNTLHPSATKELASGDSKIFDQTQLTGISMLGTSKQFGTDKIGSFSQKALVKQISKLAETNDNVLSFASSFVGRITSRWGDEKQYHAESAKAIALMLLTSNTSSSIYYGDELGVKNIGLTHLDYFQDITLHERKRALANQKVSEKEFMDAQILQNPINARSLMPWNSGENGGFSSADETITPNSQDFVNINVETQFSDKHSPLNFYKTLIQFSKDPVFERIMNNGSYKISVQKFGAGVTHITRTLGDKNIHIFVNLSSKEKNILFKKQGRVILSTYGDKRYIDTPKSLLPFEGVVITSGFNFSKNSAPKEELKSEETQQD
ncbi:alpha-amylase family glycosyl hydrolase [Mycoplasma marinum]|nr:alpha-amylase family glycosyl hydrolase [Mycoplasma marinum]